MRPVDAPFFAYRGGKARLRRFLVRWFPLSGGVYVEPFAGRGNVYFLCRTLLRFQRWWLNDLQTFRFLSLIKRFSGWSIPDAVKACNGLPPEVGQELQVLVEPLLWWAGGLAATGASFTGGRGHDLQLYQSRLSLARDLLSDVRLTKRDAVQVIDECAGSPDFFLYIDPPYLNANVGSYNDGMVDRQRMINLLVGAKCKWALSEYCVADLLDAFGEPKCRFHGVHVSPSPKSKPRRVVEALWTNYPIEKPHAMDFKDIERPMGESLRIMRKHGSLTREQFEDACPPGWGRKTQNAQFARLCAFPSCYFDGVAVVLLGR